MAELSVVINQDGKPVTRSAIAGASTEDYQWDAFHRAIVGGSLVGEIAIEDIVAALRVIRAMARAEKSGRIERIN